MNVTTGSTFAATRMVDWPPHLQPLTPNLHLTTFSAYPYLLPLSSPTSTVTTPYDLITLTTDHFYGLEWTFRKIGDGHSSRGTTQSAHFPSVPTEADGRPRGFSLTAQLTASCVLSLQ